MGRKSTKENKNIFQQIREEIGLTRNQAEQLLEYISEDRIEKIEADENQARPDEIIHMAECYKKPELPNYYCSHVCPIGKKYVPEINNKELSQITLEVLGYLNNLDSLKNRLVEISIDGQISEDEKLDFITIKDSLVSLKSTIDSLLLWIDKQKVNSGK